LRQSQAASFAFIASVYYFWFESHIRINFGAPDIASINANFSDTRAHQIGLRALKIVRSLQNILLKNSSKFKVYFKYENVAILLDFNVLYR
jgi:hypothetical protein